MIYIEVRNTDCKLVLDKRSTSFDETKVVLALLRSALEFKVKNAYFASKNNKHWDGTIKMITAQGSFGTGLLPFVYNFTSSRGYPVELLDYRENKVSYDISKVDIEGQHNLYPHQHKAVSNSIKFKVGGLDFPRGILDAATNAGKTYIMRGLISTSNASRVLVLTHRDLIFKQLMEFFNDSFGEVTNINADNTSLPRTRISVAMYQTLSNRLTSPMWENWYKGVDLLIVDESHMAKGKILFDTIRMSNAYSKFFMSGTPLEFDNDLDKAKVISISGSVLVKITNQEMFEQGISEKPTVFIAKHSKGVLTDNYDDQRRFNLLYSKERLAIKIEWLNARTHKQIIVITREVEHAKFLSEELSKHFNTFVPYVDGTHPDRDRIVKNLKERKIMLCVVTMIFKEGLNIATLEGLVNANGEKSVITVKQTVGRIIRLNKGVKKEVEVLDFDDRFEGLSSHSKSRIATYKKEGFDMKIYAP